MGYDSLVDSPQPYGDHLKRRKPAAPLESGHAFDDELASHSHVGRCLAGRGREGVVGRALGLCPLGVVDESNTRRASLTGTALAARVFATQVQ